MAESGPYPTLVFGLGHIFTLMSGEELPEPLNSETPSPHFSAASGDL